MNKLVTFHPNTTVCQPSTLYPGQCGCGADLTKSHTTLEVMVLQAEACAMGMAIGHHNADCVMSDGDLRDTAESYAIELISQHEYEEAPDTLMFLTGTFVKTYDRSR
jgi:hypothetical protein